MNRVENIVAAITVELRREDVNDILFEAFNAGGIAKWADSIVAAGEKLGDKVYEQVGLGGSVFVHDRVAGETYELTMRKLKKGFRMYLESTLHLRIEDNHIVKGDLNANEADCIVQFALFGEEKYPL